MLDKGDEPIPGYRLERFLGRGQFGEVWCATSPGGAMVALKFLNLSEQQGWKEFRAIQKVKTIRHPHLAPITALWLLDEDGNILDDDLMQGYSAGASSPRETLLPTAAEQANPPQRLVVATLLCDKNLLDRLEECRAEGMTGVAVDELLRYMEETAKGIDFLNAAQHDLGQGPVAVQHGDIKPENVMLTGDSVMIGDFGVARVLADPKSTPAATSLAGSPAYMSPECVEGKPSSKSDQYSLAVSYVELRTGELPFHGESWIEVAEAHRSGKLDLSRLPPGEMEVIRKATSVDPGDRYPSALAMVLALRRSIEKAEEAAPVRSRSWKLPVVAVGASLACLALLVGGLLTNPQWFFGNQEGGSQQPNAPVGLKEVTFRVDPPSADVLIDGKQVVPDAAGYVRIERRGDDVVQIEVRKRPEYADARETFRIADLSETRLIRLQRQPEYTARAMARRAKEKLAAAPLSESILNDSVADYVEAIRLDEPTYASIAQIEHRMLLNREGAGGRGGYSIRGMAISSDFQWLVARSDGTQVVLWSLDDLDRPVTMLHEHTAPVCNVTIAGPYVASADISQKVILSVLGPDGKTQRSMALHHLPGFEMAISPDKRWLVTGDIEGVVWRYELSSANPEAHAVELGRHQESISAMAITPDSAWVVTGGADDMVKKWNLQQAEGDAVPVGSQPGDVLCLAISANGHLAAFAGEAKTEGSHRVTVSDLRDGTSWLLSLGHTQPINALAFDATSTWLASGGEQGDVQVWQEIQDYVGGQRLAPPHLPSGRHTKSIRCLTFCPIPGWLVTGSEDGSVGIWDVTQPERKPLILFGGAGRILDVAVTSRWIVAGCDDGSILLWDLGQSLMLKRACDEVGIKPPRDPIGRRKIQVTRRHRPPSDDVPLA